MIARNFYAGGYDIFHPQVDWSGPGPGIVGTEFPLVPLLAAAAYRPFGVEEWIGRSVSVVFFLFSLVFLYRLARSFCPPRVSLLACLIYGVTPLSVQCGRSFMPDMAALSLSLGALYYFTRYLQKRNRWDHLRMSALMSLGILAKAPLAIIGLPMAYLAWQKDGFEFLRRRDLWVFAVVALVPAALWYAHAYSASTAELVFGSGKTHFFGENGLRVLSLKSYGSILQYFFLSGLTLPVLALAVAGLCSPRCRPARRLSMWWLLAFAIFLVFCGSGNKHQWYQLPAVPPLALLAGVAADSLACSLSRRKPLAFALLALLAATFFYQGRNSLRNHYKPWAEQYRTAGVTVDRLAPPDALVIAADNGNPTEIYYSGRKGWHFYNPTDGPAAVERLEEFRAAGADYLILTQYNFWWLDYYQELAERLEYRYGRAAETEDFIIFDLRHKPVSGAADFAPQSSTRPAHRGWTAGKRTNPAVPARVLAAERK